MADQDDDDDRLYYVVINDEEQYSIWFADRELPLGWHADGQPGIKQDCLDRISELWTDMRPLSLRRAMQAADQGSGTEAGEAIRTH
jgi:MbtH protein